MSDNYANSPFFLSKEEEILISTSVLARALQAVHCRRLLEGEVFSAIILYVVHIVHIYLELILFTLKDSCVMESVGAVDPSPMALLDKLTSRIDHINEDVSCAKNTLLLLLWHNCRFSI